MTCRYRRQQQRAKSHHLHMRGSNRRGEPKAVLQVFRAGSSRREPVKQQSQGNQRLYAITSRLARSSTSRALALVYERTLIFGFAENFTQKRERDRLSAGGRWIRTVGPPQHYAAGEAGVEHPVAAETRFRQGWTSIAPLADSRRLTLRLAVEGSPARPAKRSISSGCASSFLSRNLAPTTDGRSRERCRGPP
jgi:hypothetical protein